MNQQRRRLTVGGADSSRRIMDDPSPQPSSRMGLGQIVTRSMSTRDIADEGEVE